MKKKPSNFYLLYNKDLKNYEVEENILDNFLKKYDNENITDFHFEPHEEKVDVKARYCGDLITLETMGVYEYEVVLNKLLINCGYDIVKDFENIDGSFNFQNVNYRASFVRSSEGISCVLRKLRNINDIKVFMEPLILSNVEKLIDQKSKMLIFSGPTGSGKTTTMQYIVNKFKRKRKVHSIENPIEYINPGIIQIVSKIEEDKADILKYILRQDPDLIVVGEIREKNFAKLLFESSITGHLVFSSLHSKNVFLVLQRLKMFGIEVRNLSESLDLILNQRLIPKKCPFCQGNGCHNCYNTGKKGFITIFEGLIISKNLKKDISQSKSINFISEKYKNSDCYIDPLPTLRKFFNEGVINEDQYLSNLSFF
ncbi:hypothetical protein X927_02290 [Petrotoga mexicana DSM 14811]|uniref:Bacterial type II secretion system protein E domain-containing protein n=1 Tax=Petrotoga mexicana DSM 14811 TaxID=1122954 RepID=A0A2K1PDC7_9BACT|nr:ATPase, T2SS/T4P/T4SS family [Petrotoga mexicana]PNS00823.1 hypothetical protein X927_02290 [Petrotoga mexicana DSM 14811]